MTAYSAQMKNGGVSMAVKKLTPQRRTYAIVGGITGFLSVATVRFAVGGPWTVYHRLNAGAVLPPMWILGFLWFSLPVLCGFAAGLLLSGLHGAADAEAACWRGCTCLALAWECALSWYALLFGKCSLAFSLVCLLAAACLSVLCALSWRRLSIGTALLSVGNALWYLLLLLMQLSVVLHA